MTTKIKVTERLYLLWDDFNWIVLRKRVKRKATARATYHPRYYATLCGACLALLNEIPKENPAHKDIASLAKSVKASEAKIRCVVSKLQPERRRNVDTQKNDELLHKNDALSTTKKGLPQVVSD